MSPVIALMLLFHGSADAKASLAVFRAILKLSRSAISLPLSLLLSPSLFLDELFPIATLGKWNHLSFKS